MENALCVDNSYKWAGGGFLSTAADLVQFGNAILYSFQNDDGYLSRDICKIMWSAVDNTKMPWDRDGAYAMGWGVVEPRITNNFCKSRQFYVSHTGGAIGASSVLLVMPTDNLGGNCEGRKASGVVVAMIVNMQSVGLNKVALEIAQIFDQLS